MRLVFTLVLTGVAVAGAILGYRVLAGNDGQKSPSQDAPPDAIGGPVSATPGEQDAESPWTPEKLKAAKPLDLPSPATPPDLDPAAGAGPSQSGAGSAGGPDAEAGEGGTLIPGLTDPDSENGSTQK